MVQVDLRDMASSGVTQSIESLFGPPSQLIDITNFIQNALASLAKRDVTQADEDDVDMDIKVECSVDDMKRELEEILRDPLLAAQLDKSHEQMVGELYASHTKNKKSGKKTAGKDLAVLDPAVDRMQKQLDAVQLKCWKLNPESVMFVRPPRNSDNNTLAHLRLRVNGTMVSSQGNDAVLTISIFNRVPWGPSYVTRLCQHAFLSSQTLRDVYDALPCIYRASSASPSNGNPAGMKPGVTCCIENVLHSDSHETSRKVLAHFACLKRPEYVSKPSIAAVSLSERNLASLSLRLNFPYPIIHAGNCEHFMVVEQIRLLHPSDPVSGYPVTLQITPPLPTLCYACHKIPATVAVVGDVRLGESPSLMCSPCWNAMGNSDDELVVVTALPS